MEALWFGESENAFFSYEDLSKARRIKNAVYTKNFYEYLDNKTFKYQNKKQNEIRILCSDIAVMGGNKNDATAIFVLQLLPMDNFQYIRNVIYAETMDGGHTETQSILIRKLYDEFECNYLVLDTAGVGISIYDNIAKDLIDPDTGIVYPALSCMNDEEMHKRCKGENPDRVIYSVKASSSFNSEIALQLRDCIKRGKTRLLVSEVEIEEELKTIRQYNNLPPEDKAKILLPFIQTSLLLNEMINLDKDAKSNVIKLKEKSGGRKDRYSSLAYGNYFATVLERNLKKPPKEMDISKLTSLARKPNIYNRKSS